MVASIGQPYDDDDDNGAHINKTEDDHELMAMGQETKTGFITIHLKSRGCSQSFSSFFGAKIVPHSFPLKCETIHQRIYLNAKNSRSTDFARRIYTNIYDT